MPRKPYIEMRDTLFMDPEDEFESMIQARREIAKEIPGGHAGGSATPKNAWDALSRGLTIGKRIGLNLVSGGGQGVAGLDMFTLSGNDSEAMPLSITLCPPEAIQSAKLNPVPTTSGANPNLSTGQSNQQITNFNFGPPFVRIKWGVGGISSQIEVDIHNGCKLTLDGSYVSITGFVGDPAIDAVSGGGYTLAAFVSPGRDKGRGGQRTIEATNSPAVNVETQAFRVPTFARRIRMSGIENVPSAGFVGSIIFYRGINLAGDTGVLQLAEYLFASNTPDDFPIPNGAFFFTMVPRTAIGAGGRMQAIFDLAI